MIFRLLKNGSDSRTNAYVRWVLTHFKQSVWNLFRLLNLDTVAEERERLLNYALLLPEPIRADFENELAFLSQCDFDTNVMFPYCVVGAHVEVESGHDPRSTLPFVLHKGRRLYFPADYGTEKAVAAYRDFIEREGLLGTGILAKSPHSYVSPDFKVTSEDVVVDVGCAEALFALDNVEIARKICLFECEKRWRKALEETFRPYASKVTIHPKRVGDGKSGTVRLMDVIDKLGDRYFLKMDVEGAEYEVLNSSRDFLVRNKVKLSCCVYHRQEDAASISRLLENLGYRYEFSDGWILTAMNGIRFPFFRHGVIRARNY